MPVYFPGSGLPAGVKPVGFKAKPSEGGLFADGYIPVGLDLLIGGAQSTKNPIMRDPPRNGLLVVDFFSVPMYAANCTHTVTNIPNADTGCAGKKGSQDTGRKITTINTNNPQVAYQLSSVAQGAIGDSVQLWMYFDNRGAWPDAPYVCINFSDGWSSGSPSGNVIQASVQVARYPGWQCVEVRKENFVATAGSLDVAWASPGYCRVYFTGGATAGSSVVLSQMRWAVRGVPLISIVLDNAYENQMKAAEILSRYGLIGNFSGVPERFSTITDGKTRMSKSHFLDLASMGHRSIQHTYATVSSLGGLQAWANRVIADTRAWQDSGLDADIDVLLYLQGDFTASTYDRALADWTQAAGFTCACSSYGGGFVGQAGYRRWQLPRLEMQGPGLSAASVVSNIAARAARGEAVITKTHHLIPSPVNPDDTSISTFEDICAGIAALCESGAAKNVSLRDLALRRS